MVDNVTKLMTEKDELQIAVETGLLEIEKYKDQNKQKNLEIAIVTKKNEKLTEENLYLQKEVDDYRTDMDDLLQRFWHKSDELEQANKFKITYDELIEANKKILKRQETLVEEKTKLLMNEIVLNGQINDLLKRIITLTEENNRIKTENNRIKTENSGIQRYPVDDEEDEEDEEDSKK